MQGTSKNQEGIDLVDLIRIVWKRKYLVIYGTFLLALMAAGIAFLLPKLYEVTAIMEPGKRPISDQNEQVVSEKVVESPQTIMETIKAGAYDEDLLEKLKIGQDKIPKIRAEVLKNTDLLKLTVLSDNPQMAVEWITALVTRMGEALQKKIDFEKDIIRNKISLAKIKQKATKDQVMLLKQLSSDTRGVINDLEEERKRAIANRRSDAMSVLLYSNEIQNKHIYLNDLQEKINALEAESLIREATMDNLLKRLADIKATTLHKKPTIPSKPAKPQKLLIIGIAFIIGLIATVILSIFLEYLEGTKTNKSIMPLGGE